MKYALLVAIREYVENAKTKGFWIGIMLFPIMILIAVQVPRFLDKATPTRHFTLVDQSGRYGAVVDQAVRRNETRQKKEAYQKYVQKYIDPDRVPPTAHRDLETVHADMVDPEKLLGKFMEANPEMLDMLGTPTGWQLEVARLEPFLQKDRPPFTPPRPRFVRVPLPEGVAPDGSPAEIARALKPFVLGESQVAGPDGPIDLFAAVIVPRDVTGKSSMAAMAEKAGLARPSGIEFWSVNLTDKDLQEVIERAVNEEYRRLAYLEHDVDPATVKNVEQARVPFHAKNPRKAEGKEDVSVADVIRQYAPIAFVYLLWVAIFTVSQMLLNNTIEEKSNRIIEVLLSSVTSGELMMGKLLGIAAIGLTMTGAWILALLGVLTLFRSPEAAFVDQAMTVLRTSNLLPLFAVYFLLGYLFYAGIFLSIGSICNTLKEAQNFMGPMMMVMMVPLITMFFIPKDPNGPLATVLSWIPFYTPFVMMNRAAANPPVFDQVGTVVLMLIATAGMLWLSAKIFRIGILRTGQPPKLFEIFRWVKNPA
jgi:ABC-2 type transport system permease protein